MKLATPPAAKELGADVRREAMRIAGDAVHSERGINCTAPQRVHDW